MADNGFKTQYDLQAPIFEKLKQEVIYILEHEISKANIPIHMIGGRVKKFDSILSKAKRLDIQDPLEALDDICGIRVICLFLSDLRKLEEIINNVFEVMKKDDKLESKKQDQFGYFSIHFICKLSKSYIGPRYDDITNFRFEIQLRTIAMHAWATISHYLDYKSPQAIPSELKKDFQALSGLFYVADSHFELFFKSSMIAREETKERIEQGSNLNNEEINLDTLLVFLEQKYPERDEAMNSDVAELAEELQEAGYKSLGEVNNDLDKAAKAFRYYETNYPPGDDEEFNRIGVVRVSFEIASKAYLDYKLKRNNPGTEALKKIAEAREFL